MEDKAAKARELFQSGANCAQAVFAAFSEECGISRETALRMASGFGGGIARQREVCGTVSGMVMAADMLWGSADLSDKAAKDAHYALIQKLCQAFRAETGSIVCRELLGLAPRQSDPPESEARTPAYYKKRPCAELTALAAGILQRELEQHRNP